MSDAKKPRTCITHFNACDCREKRFARLQKQNEILREGLNFISAYEPGPPYDYCAEDMIAEAKETLDRADELEGK